MTTTTNRNATRAVINNLSKSAGKDAWTEVWESLPSGSVEEFREAGIRRLLGSSLRRRTLDSADWTEVYAHFHPDATGPVTFGSAAELGDTMPQVLLAVAALVEGGCTGLRIESGPLAGHESALVELAPALAQLHRNLVAERVSAGLAAASEQGRKPGRRKEIDDDDARTALAARVESGETLTEAARAVGVSRATAYRLLPATARQPDRA